MPLVSRDYGISGDEFVDHTHSGYVLDYYAKGDKAALNQPKTALHLYGNVVQVIAAAACRAFDIDNYYEFRHLVGSLVGALGIIFTGLFGLRFSGGLGGLITLLMMFFTPRFFGHSMNNLKDVPFAVGYLITLYYAVRLFDNYPKFKKSHIVGAILGIALALGTRSGGLILYPMLLMYAGLFYIERVGVKEFYKFGKYINDVGRIFAVLFIVLIGSYLLSIVLWPYALDDPFNNVVKSLKEFTNYNIGLRTIFDGKQMMSTMLVWYYAPKYLLIGLPLVTVLGFIFYFVYCIFSRKEFSLISFWLLFASIFPVFWVIYQNSNLYGGIRHLLFVMPPMVILAARFWTQIIQFAAKYKYLPFAIFLGLLTLPIIHTIKNHPNQYVYFNEIAGGMDGAYGDYDTDYYYNSLNESIAWFKENVDLPKDTVTLVATNHLQVLQYYFRDMPHVKPIYSRYYNKFSTNWDYAIFGNVYINRFQLKNNLFPPSGALYTPTVDSKPMSCVIKRESKEDLVGFALDKANDFKGAIAVFEDYVKKITYNDEAWCKLGKAYFSLQQYDKAHLALDKARELYPTSVEAVYYKTLIYLNERKFSEASLAADEILRENDKLFNFWHLKAVALTNMGKLKEAIDCINKTLMINPGFYQAFDLAGDIFRTTNSYAQAYSMYSQAFKITKSKSICAKIVNVLLKQNKQKEAAAYQKLLGE